MKRTGIQLVVVYGFASLAWLALTAAWLVHHTEGIQYWGLAVLWTGFVVGTYFSSDRAFVPSVNQNRTSR